MKDETPMLDNRLADDIYAQALQAADYFLPGWTQNWAGEWPEDPAYFNPEDNAMVLLKLFARMSEIMVSQLNRVPEKHKIAFYDFMGLHQEGASPARVPLSFTLANGAKGAFVEKGAKFSSSENDQIIFETQAPLTLTPFKFSDVISFSAWQDACTIHASFHEAGEKSHHFFGQSAITAFTPGAVLPASQEDIHIPAPHWFNIKHGILFNVKKPTQVTVDITLTGVADASTYLPLFKYWLYNGIDMNITPTSTGGVVQGIFTLSPPEEESAPQPYVNIWPDMSVVSDSATVIPQIQSVGISLVASGITPDFIYGGKNLIDPANGGYPFSTTPEVEDSLYLGCDETFSKEGANITLTFECKTVAIANALTLAWEYWDGALWQDLSVTDTTNQLKSNGTISFTAPAIPESKINGKKNRWIRARIASGDYGIGAWSENTTRTVTLVDNVDNVTVSKNITHKEVVHHPATYDPPFITSLQSGYQFNATAPEEMSSVNYHEPTLVDVAQAETTYLYKLKTSENPALYLGFEKNHNSSPLSLFFMQKERAYNNPLWVLEKPDTPTPAKAEFEWQYYNGAWSRIEGLEDTTNFLKEEGIVSFMVPGDATPGTFMGKERYWLRLAVTSGEKLDAPVLKGIFPNTVMALNQVSMSNETLGSSNGKPGQSFTFSRKPLLEDKSIVIIESETPVDEEAALLFAEEGKDAITPIEDETGRTKEYRVRWHEILDFSLSEPGSRHYTIDHEEGRITFGDGTHGMIPPRGVQNIIAESYSSGGGSRGNCPALTISTMKRATPNVDSVTNFRASSHGRDRESMKNLLKRAPYSIRTKERAVTLEDYEVEAKEGHPDIYAVKAALLEDDTIEVALLPDSPEPMPRPTAQMIEGAQNYLEDKALFMIKPGIKVIGVTFAIIDCDVSFKPVNIGEIAIVKERITAAVSEFLHPVKGYSHKKGWDFGQPIYVSDLSTELEMVEGVDYITDLQLALQASTPAWVGGIAKIEINPLEIIACGDITLTATI